MSSMAHSPSIALLSRLSAPVGDSKAVSITPSVIFNQYKIPQNISNQSPLNSQAVASFLEQYYSDSDLNTFFQRFGLAKNPVKKVVGPNDQTKPGVEASLDVRT